MKNKKFFNLDHAIRYLNESVITFKGKPIFIYSLDSGRHGKNFQLFYYDVGNANEQKTILSDNDGIDMTPVPLGLLSCKNDMTRNTGLVVRVPKRMYKVGLNRDNVVIYHSHPDMSPRHRGRPTDLLMSKELRDTVVGDYPSYKECLETTKKVGNVLAFSRRFAVAEGKLYFRATGVPVGKATKDGPVLDENAFWIKEMLEEDIKNV